MKKICTVCKTEKPIEDFRVYSGRSRNGRRPLCKICQRNYERTWRSNHSDQRKIQRARHAEKAAVYSRDYRAKNRAKYLVAEIRRRCVSKEIAFDLDQHIEEIQRRINVGVCEVSGFPLELAATQVRKGSAGIHPATPSIDRKAPDQGYTLTNIRIVCFAVNAAMGNWGESEFLKIAKVWIERM